MTFSDLAFKSLAHVHGTLVVEELVRAGVDEFCISSGARIIPLILGFEQLPQVSTRIFNDERSAAFWAQGFGKSGKLACLLCTSGTAAANYLPAIVEARMSETPLLIITADRPAELLYAKSNQTIDQRQMYGSFVLRSLDIPAPERSIFPHSLFSNLDQAVHIAKQERGPVHLNISYRKPFVDPTFSISYISAEERGEIEAWFASGKTYCDFRTTFSSIDKDELAALVAEIDEAERPAIICGPLSAVGELDSITALAEKLSAPIFADINSGLRFRSDSEMLFSRYGSFLAAESIGSESPDLVLYFGERIISEPLREYVERSDARMVQFASHQGRQDGVENEFLRINKRYVVDPLALASDLERECKPSGSGRPFFLSLKAKEEQSESSTKELLLNTENPGLLSEGQVVQEVFANVTRGSSLYIAPSLLLREAEYFSGSANVDLILGANRGSNGIDGVLSSGLGFAAGLERPLTVLIGDQAMLHDLNALAHVASSPQPCHIFVFNNSGGAIFNVFKLGESNRVLENPHDFSFKDAASMFGLAYRAPESIEDLNSLWLEDRNAGRSAIFEVRCEGAESVRVFKASEFRS